MQEIASGLNLILPLIEKGGATAFLAGIAWYFWREHARRTSELMVVYAQRDAYKYAFEQAKGKIDLLKLKLGQSVDLDVDDPKIPEIPIK